SDDGWKHDYGEGQQGSDGAARGEVSAKVGQPSKLLSDGYECPGLHFARHGAANLAGGFQFALVLDGDLGVGRRMEEELQLIANHRAFQFPMLVAEDA